MKKFKLQDIEFRTSRYSNIDPVPFCVAVGQMQNGSIVVRHSQDSDPDKSLVFTKGEWEALVKGVKAKEFDF